MTITKKTIIAAQKSHYVAKKTTNPPFPNPKNTKRTHFPKTTTNNLDSRDPRARGATLTRLGVIYLQVLRAKQALMLKLTA